MTMLERWKAAIAQIGGAAGLLALPEEVREILKDTDDLETKVKMLELITENLK